MNTLQLNQLVAQMQATGMISGALRYHRAKVRRLIVSIRAFYGASLPPSAQKRIALLQKKVGLTKGANN